MARRTPHLTPAKLVGERFPKNTFGNARIALLGYCPPPEALGKYRPQKTVDQYFIHVTRDSVTTFTHQGISFISLVHVYGGPVSASTVEELAYFGFDYILAYGLAGGLGTKGLKMGDYYLVESALVADGTTPHYTKDKITRCDSKLKSTITRAAKETALARIKPVRAITGDAIYQEHDSFLNRARNKGCDIVNLDSSHLFAVSKNNNCRKKIRTVECGVISDVTEGKNKGWDSTLSVMLSSQKGSDFNPLALTGNIVEFYVEKLAPLLK